MCSGSYQQAKSGSQSSFAHARMTWPSARLPWGSMVVQGHAGSVASDGYLCAPQASRMVAMVVQCLMGVKGSARRNINGLSHPGTRTVWLPQAWGPHGRARPVAVGLALGMDEQRAVSGWGPFEDMSRRLGVDVQQPQPTSSTLAARRGLGLGVGWPTAQARTRRETEVD